MSTDTISLHCDGCGANLRLAAGKMRPGASAPCPRCGSMIQFPGPSSAAPAPVAVEEIQCQICGTLLRLRADRRPPGGGTAPCPRCKSAVTIPPADAPRASAPAAPAPAANAARTPRSAPAAIAAPVPRPAPAAPRPRADSEMLPAGIGIGASTLDSYSGTQPVQPAPRPVAVAAPPQTAPDPEVAGGGGAAGDAGDEPAIEIHGEEEEEQEPNPVSAASRPAAPDRTLFWTVEIGGESLHPGGVAELRLWARQGKLRAEDRVRRGENEWVPAREVPEIASLFARQRPAQEKTRIAVRGGLSRETLRAGAAGLAGGALAVPPVAALLIFSGEFERVAAALGTGTLPGLALLCGGIVCTGALAGLVMATLQKHYDRRGEVVNLWSGSGAALSGVACGAACGLAALAFWPPSSPFALVFGFAVFGTVVSLLTLLSYRWLFQDRKA